MHGFAEAEVTAWLADPTDPLVIVARSRREHALADRMVRLAEAALTKIAKRITDDALGDFALVDAFAKIVDKTHKLRELQHKTLQSERDYAHRLAEERERRNGPTGPKQVRWTNASYPQDDDGEEPESAD